MVVSPEDQGELSYLEKYGISDPSISIEVDPTCFEQKAPGPKGEVCVGKTTGQFFECGHLMAEIYNEQWKVEFMEFLRSKGVDVREI